MRANKTTKMKALIIEDEHNHFSNIKKWLEKFDYAVIPDKFDEMGKALRNEPGIDILVQTLLQNNYRDIGLILCDIRFGNDLKKGSRIVKHIREFNNLSPSYWTSIVPIICMTNYADLDMLEDSIISSGADFVFRKSIIFNDLKGTIDKNDRNEANTYRTIIDSQVEKFQKSLKLLYPNGLEDKIIRFLNRPKNKKTAFIMTSFHGQHMSIAKRVLQILCNYNIRGYIADMPGGLNDSRVWENIEVFMHGCDFGIAIYIDDTEPDDEGKKRDNRTNLNVSVEVGYMLGLKKEVCILKYTGTERIPSDIIGMNYVTFTTENLEFVLRNWLEYRQIINQY